MAARDVTNFQFLKDAILQKFKHPGDIEFRGRLYEPITNSHSVFGNIYMTFQDLMYNKGLVLAPYLNVQDRSILEKLYRNLDTDPNLSFLKDPNSALQDPRYELSEEYYQRQMAKDAAEKQGVSTQATAPTTGGQPSVPIAGTTKTAKPPRVVIIQNQKEETEKPKEEQNPANEPQESMASPQEQQTHGQPTQDRPSIPQMPQATGLPSAYRARSQLEGVGGLNPGLRFQSGFGNQMKNFGSRFQVLANKGGRTLLGGLKAFAQPAGGLLGGSANSAGSSIIKSINKVPNVFSGGFGPINQGKRALGNAGSNLGKVGKSRLKWVILGMLLFGGIFGLVTSSNPTGQPVSTAPITGVTGDISSCKFTRSDQSPKAINYLSSIILNYFQETSAKSGIPAAVLAAFTRVESPSLTPKANEDLDTLECAVSDTGALGIMQLQPKGTKGHDEGAIAQGASFIGKKYNELTREDYCNPEKNILMGAGFILKKMSYFGFGDGTKWDPAWTTNKEAIYALVKGYYGCEKYGAKADPNKINPETGLPEKQSDIKCDDPRHNYNYGDDVWTSIQGCQIQSNTITDVISCPVPGGIISTQSYQANPSKGHCSSGYLAEGRCREDCPGGMGGSRRAKAIDVLTNGKKAELPTINSERVNWTLVIDPYRIDKEDGGGWGYTFLASQGGHSYYLDMLHLNYVEIKTGKAFASGEKLTAAEIDHVHMTIGKDLSSTPVAKSSTDCDPNWLPSDFMCK